MEATVADFSDELSDDAVPDIVLVLSSVLFVLHQLHHVRKADVFGDHFGEVCAVAVVRLVASQRCVVVLHQVRCSLHARKHAL